MEGSDAEAAASKHFHDAPPELVDPDDPNRDGGGGTAILEAARHNRPEVAAALLDAGCDPSLGDNKPNVARLLLQSLTARWDVVDSAGGLTPLHVMVKSAVSTNVTPTASQLEVLKEVARMSNTLRCIWRPSGRHDRPEVVRVVLDAVPTMTLCNAQNDRGETPLHLAVVNGNYETALALLEHVEVLRRGRKRDDDRDQEILEHEAIQDRLQQAAQGKQREITQDQNDAIQRQNGAEIPSDKSTDEEHGNSIKIARITKKPDEKTTHNRTDCDVQNADQNGNAPSGTGTTVARIEVDLCDRFGQTVLHYCAARNATSVLEPLLRNSGVCDVQDLQGDTALHVAARRGHDRSLALLLQFGADPSIRNNDGRTALDLAVAAGFADATKVLYENATEPVLRNADALRRQDSVRRCTRIGRIFLADEVPISS
ncbi:hypothetical protein HPB47_014942, partial [Ixodes persulcatus]